MQFTVLCTPFVYTQCIRPGAKAPEGIRAKEKHKQDYATRGDSGAFAVFGALSRACPFILEIKSQALRG
jgi:hypothetical protein